MRVEDKEVDGVAWVVTEGVLERVRPEVLPVDKGRIEQLASSPLQAVDLGRCAASLRSAATIFRTIREAIRQAVEYIAQGGPGEIKGREDVADLIKQYLESQRMSGDLDVDLLRVLEDFFSQHPSSVDQIFGLSLSPPASLRCEPLGTLTRGLLKVVDPQGHISSAFAISEQGYVLTAAHAVGRHEEVHLVFQYRSPTGGLHERDVQGTVVHHDVERDICILWCPPQSWNELASLGLCAPPLGLDWRPGSWVLCLGYQEQEIFLDPVAVEAFVKRWDPVHAVRFRDGHEQGCLVLTIPHRAPPIVPGMSGAPVMDLDRCRVIGMVTGATREAWVRQEWRGEEIWELITGRYGFVIPLTRVRETWPLFREYCLAQTKPKEVSQDGVK